MIISLDILDVDILLDVRTLSHVIVFDLIFDVIIFTVSIFDDVKIGDVNDALDTF